MRITYIENHTKQLLYWTGDPLVLSEKICELSTHHFASGGYDMSSLMLFGVANGRIVFGLTDGRRVVVYLDDNGEWGGGGIMSQPNKCLSHDPVDMGMSWSFCRICNATLKFVNFEWKTS